MSMQHFIIFSFRRRKYEVNLVYFIYLLILFYFIYTYLFVSFFIYSFVCTFCVLFISPKSGRESPGQVLKSGTFPHLFLAILPFLHSLALVIPLSLLATNFFHLHFRSFCLSLPPSHQLSLHPDLSLIFVPSLRIVHGLKK